MQNWEIMSANNVNNYGESNSWYNNMFAANVKTEPGTSNTKTLLQQQQPHHQQNQQHDQHLGSFLRQSQQQRQLLQPQQQQQHQQQQQPPPPPPPPQFTSLGTNAATVPSLPNNNNEQMFGTTNPQHIMQQQQQYQQQFQHAQQAAAQNQTTSPLMLGFNPLTPPGLPNAVIPTTMSHFYPPNTARCNRETPSPIPINGNVNLEQSEKSILTPRYTPPMDITPPKSPKSTAALTEPAHHDKEQEPDLMSSSSEDLKHVTESGEYDEYIRMPIYNSHGKMKTHKCKTCGLVAMTKVSFWEHTRTHESSEKILQCPKCPFWAKVKHHLDFHICKHKNVKPYKCDKCEYSCENKSMLASHHKKHSSIYHYRCADCDYATKFCHAFKQHLRKYEHKPGLVLDHDGLPNPTVIIDVYGTRRGPKNKTANCGTGSKRMLNGDLKLPSISSQLSAALQGFTNHQTSMPDSPTKSTTSQNSDFPPLNTNNIPLLPQNPSNLHNGSSHNISDIGHTSLKERRKNNTNHSPTNLTGMLPLDTLNHNMTSFLSYYINLQVLAAQQQPGVLAQLSPHMREELQKQQQRFEESINDEEEKTVSDTDEEEDEESDSDEQEHEDKVSKAMNSGKTEASAIDLTQCASNTEHRTPARMEKVANDNEETPLIATTGAAKRKGRVLKLDQDQLKYNNNNNNYEMPSAEKQIFDETSKSPSPVTKKEAKRKLNRSVEDLMDTDYSENISSSQPQNALGKTSINTSNSSIDTSSGSVSSVSGTVTSSSNANSNTDTLYECAHCHIFFKNAVLHTMHMGYHSCDDVFKCNMCGKKCEDAVGFFVHMARNAHP